MAEAVGALSHGGLQRAGVSAAGAAAGIGDQRAVVVENRVRVDGRGRGGRTGVSEHLEVVCGQRGFVADRVGGAGVGCGGLSGRAEGQHGQNHDQNRYQIEDLLALHEKAPSCRIVGGAAESCGGWKIYREKCSAKNHCTSPNGEPHGSTMQCLLRAIPPFLFYRTDVAREAFMPGTLPSSGDDASYQGPTGLQESCDVLRSGGCGLDRIALNGWAAAGRDPAKRATEGRQTIR